MPPAPTALRVALRFRREHGPIYESRGAVVEQFRVTGVDQMMSFDCGGFELK
jgi:hypothetical protein